MATYYIETTGTDTIASDGSISKPWASLNYAFSKVAASSHTFLVGDGVYNPTAPGSNVQIPTSCTGVSGFYTTIKSINKWGAVIDGATIHGITFVGNGLVNWVIIDGFKVTNVTLDGIKVEGSNCIVRNCWVVGASGQGMSSHGSAHNYSDNIFDSNLVEYCGTTDSLDHGAYIDGARYTFKNNIFRHNPKGRQMQLWSDLSDSKIYNNLLIGHFEALTIGENNGDTPNLVVNNTIVCDGLGIQFYGCNGDIVANNIIISGDPVTAPTVYTTIDAHHNLCNPADSDAGSPQVTSDPQFTNPGSEKYYLSSLSPARGFGDASVMPTENFWGQPNTSTYVGCFEYFPSLVTSPPSDPWQSPTVTPDYTIPYCSITSPAKNLKATGVITITAAASDNVGVSHVDIYVDNILIDTLTSAPYTTTFDTSSWRRCTAHSIKAVAYDNAGNRKSAIISLTKSPK